MSCSIYYNSSNTSWNFLYDLSRSNVSCLVWPSSNSSCAFILFNVVSQLINVFFSGYFRSISGTVANMWLTELTTSVNRGWIWSMLWRFISNASINVIKCCVHSATSLPDTLTEDTSLLAIDSGAPMTNNRCFAAGQFNLYVCINSSTDVLIMFRRLLNFWISAKHCFMYSSCDMESLMNAFSSFSVA